MLISSGVIRIRSCSEDADRNVCDDSSRFFLTQSEALLLCVCPCIYPIGASWYESDPAFSRHDCIPSRSKDCFSFVLFFPSFFSSRTWLRDRPGFVNSIADSTIRLQTLETYGALKKGCAATEKSTYHSYGNTLKVREYVREKELLVQGQYLDLRECIFKPRAMTF